VKLRAIIIVNLCFLAIFVTDVAGERSVVINVYNDGFSQITEIRQVELVQGINSPELVDIAEKIDPGSIDLSGEGVEIRSIDYRYDLISADQLLRKFIGQEIGFKKDDSLYSGTLINFDDNYLYISMQGGSGSVAIFERDDFQYVDLPSLPEKLVTRPIISAILHSDISGTRDIKLSYLTYGLSWQAEYHLVYDGNQSADLTGWVNLDNQCGTAFPDAEVILIAGKVEREVAAAASTSGDAEQIEAYKPRKSSLEPLVDYYRYKLPITIDLGEMETRQAMMLEPTAIEVEHYYKYQWTEPKSEVKSMLSFKNESGSGPALPLPSGRISIYDKASGAFLGSSKFDSTPIGEKAEIILGAAFDITVERKRIDHKKISRDKNSDTFEIKIRNQKQDKVKIIVAEELYGYWEIIEKSDDFTKKDFQNIEFELFVEAGQEKILTYTVEYSY